MEQSHYPEFQTSSKRALIFLNLAIEQLRLFDDTTAGIIFNNYYKPLELVFNQAINYAKQANLPGLSRREARILYEAGSTIFTELVEDMKLAPPGLGQGLFPEEEPRGAFEPDGELTLKASRFEARKSASSAFAEYAFPSFGVIGQRRSSSFSVEPKQRHEVVSALSTLVDGSEPLNMNSPVNGWNIQPKRSSHLETADASRRTSAQSNLTQGSYVTSQVPLPSGGVALNQSALPEVYSTEDVHSIGDDNEGVSIKSQSTSRRFTEKSDNHHHNTGLNLSQDASKSVPSTWAKVAAIDPSAIKGYRDLSIAPTKPKVTKLPTEKPLAQKRVIWLHPLPEDMTLYKLSLKIKEGPVFSILLEHDQHETLPGLSACIIFQHTESVTSLLNGFDNRGFPKETEAKVGSAFPMDADLQSMSALPHFRRRRLKWSRARLFYQVNLIAFKKLVLKFAGGNANVELVHFYNAGEATAVFASVGVAKAVYDGFKQLRTGLGCSAEHAVLWKMVDISFVTDLNEKPTSLYSQYGADGQIRCFAPGMKCEGLFAGPVVTDEQVFGKA